MNNTSLKKIIDYATSTLRDNYGYCGVAEGDTIAMLNSSDGENDIKIKITIEED